MKSQEDKILNNIEILSMKYEVVGADEMNGIKGTKTAIYVELMIGNMKGFIKIPTKLVNTMSEERIKGYIYNYVNSTLERKFIDEI